MAGTMVHVQVQPKMLLRSVTAPGSTGPVRRITCMSCRRCEVTEMSTWVPMYGLRGVNHICSSPRQPTMVAGVPCNDCATVTVATGMAGANVAAVAAEAVAVGPVVWAITVCVAPTEVAWRATEVAPSAVAVAATEVAVPGTPGGSVSVGV